MTRRVGMLGVSIIPRSSRCACRKTEVAVANTRSATLWMAVMAGGEAVDESTSFNNGVARSLRITLEGS